MDETRKAFEAWFNNSREVFNPEGMAVAWHAWQAATMAERERAAGICERVAAKWVTSDTDDGFRAASGCADHIMGIGA